MQQPRSPVEAWAVLRTIAFSLPEIAWNVQNPGNSAKFVRFALPL
jgi:hypothetical protein